MSLLRNVILPFTALSLALGASLVATPALAAKEKAEAPSATPSGPPPSPALWKIADDDTTLYLFGVIGLAPEDADWRSRAMARAIDVSETIWFEAPVDDPDAQAGANELFAREAMAAEGETLSEQLSDAAREALPAVAAEAGLGLETLEPLKPWAAFIVLSSRVAPPSADQTSEAVGIDALLMREARGRGREMRYFATVEQSLRNLIDLPAKRQAALAASLITDFDRQRDGARETFEAWRIGDVEAVDALLNAKMRDETPALFGALVSARAESHASGVAEMLKAPGSAFIALDISYLVGPGSIPDRLAAAGLSVERVEH